MHNRCTTTLALLAAIATAACCVAQTKNQTQNQTENQTENRLENRALFQPEPPTHDAEGIAWLHDLDEAMALSKVDGRPVIAYFTFNACVWCKRLERDTYSDATVIELSRKFIWVKVNRDDTPEIPPQFSVSAYPSLITLGAKREKIHRFSGYKLPADFIGQLEDALARYAVYKAGGEWEPKATRPDSICNTGTVEVMPAPSEDNPAGMAIIDNDLWIMQGSTLYRTSLATGIVQDTFNAPRGSLIVDLATDGVNLYLASYGWSAGKPVFVFDPRTESFTREIVTEANKDNRSHSTRGLVYYDKSLWVLSGLSGTITRIDTRTGEIKQTLQPAATRLSSLALLDGKFVTGTKDEIIQIDPDTGKVTRRAPTDYPLRSIAVRGTDLYLMEQPVWDFNIDNKRVRVWPKETMIYKLTLDPNKG